MSSYYYYPHPAPYPYSPPARPVSADTHLLLRSMATGATVGAAAATAAQLHNPTADGHNALGQIARAGAVTGLATGAAQLTQHRLGCEHKWLTFGAMFLAGAAVFYTLNPAEKSK